MAQRFLCRMCTPTASVGGAFCGALGSCRGRVQTSVRVYRLEVEVGAVRAGQTIRLTLKQHFTGRLVPLPVFISQGEPQLVVFSGSAVWVSPYDTTRQTTTVQLPSRRVEDYSVVEPTRQQRTTLVYGPYDATVAGSREPMRVHFENNSPFITADSVEREIEVSHWGNVAVEEHYEVHHAGAKLAGGFSRLDYQVWQHTCGRACVLVASPTSPPPTPQTKSVKSSSFRKFTCVLPASASGMYYRDIIGNISTSEVSRTRRSTKLQVC